MTKAKLQPKKMENSSQKVTERGRGRQTGVKCRKTKQTFYSLEIIPNNKRKT